MSEAEEIQEQQPFERLPERTVEEVMADPQWRANQWKWAAAISSRGGR